MITDSEFAFQFQLMDHALVESCTTRVMIEEIKHYGKQQLNLAGGTLVVDSYQILVKKID